MSGLAIDAVSRYEYPAVGFVGKTKVRLVDHVAFDIGVVVAPQCHVARNTDFKPVGDKLTVVDVGFVNSRYFDIVASIVDSW